MSQPQEQEKIAMAVAVHKASIALMKGESLQGFTKVLSDAGRDHLRKKKNLSQKGNSVWLVEAFGDYAVFELYTDGPQPPAGNAYYAISYKRDKNGAFDFGTPIEVQRVTTFQPTSDLSVAKRSTENVCQACGEKFKKGLKECPSCKAAVAKVLEDDEDDDEETTKAFGEWVEVSKPFPNEHAARQTDPGQYDTFRRVHLKGFPDGVDVIFGIKTKPKRVSEIQTIRFDAKKWTVDQANKWLKDHNFKSVNEPAAPAKKTTKAIVGDWEETAQKSLWDGVI